MTIDRSSEAKARRREKLKEAAVLARLAGLDPEGPAFDKTPDLIVDGEITTDQAVAMILADALAEATPPPPLSEAEIAKYREADSNAVWSLRMAGSKTPPKSEALHHACKRGEITMEQLTAALDAHYKQSD